MATLYVVATPIGNLEDITLRALRILNEVDIVLCEDTRVTKTLLERHRIQAKTISFHQHSELEKTEEIFALLKEGKNCALVSDAGTPGVSDPGNELVARVAQQFGQVQIVPIPGPSALAAAASIAGFPMDRFVFMGFPPAKKGRKKFFEGITTSQYPVIFYESPYRIFKSLSELPQEAKVVVARELTKKFETVYRGTVKEVASQLKESNAIKGEFVIVVKS